MICLTFEQTPISGQSAITVRRAAPADIERLAELGTRMHGEGAFAFLPFDLAKVRRFAADYCGAAPNRCGLVAERGGRIIGMFAGHLSEYFFCREKIACDMLLYVEPEARGSSAAARLVAAFRAWARAQGAREICLATSNNIEPEVTGRFYQTLGFTRTGSIYKERIS